MAAGRDRVPDWLLERLAAGELPDSQAAEVRERLKAQGQQHRLTELADSSARILASRHPSQSFPKSSVEPRGLRSQSQPPVVCGRCGPCLRLRHAPPDWPSCWSFAITEMAGDPRPTNLNRKSLPSRATLKPALRIYRKFLRLRILARASPRAPRRHLADPLRGRGQAFRRHRLRRWPRPSHLPPARIAGHRRLPRTRRRTRPAPRLRARRLARIRALPFRHLGCSVRDDRNCTDAEERHRPARLPHRVRIDLRRRRTHEARCNPRRDCSSCHRTGPGR